jgi:hypothetical protein
LALILFDLLGEVDTLYEVMVIVVFGVLVPAGIAAFYIWAVRP